MAHACTLIGGHWGGGGSFTGPPNIKEKTRVKLVFQKESKVFTPGERVNGSVRIYFTEGNWPTPWIHGLLLEFEGNAYVKETKENQQIAEKKKYFYGSATRVPEPLRRTSYEFSFTIPEDCPATFNTGTGGSLKYNLRIVAAERSEGLCTLVREELTIIAKPVLQWENSKFFLQPMLEERRVFISSSPDASVLDLSFNTNQKCYEPGHDICFGLEIRNGNVNIVKGITVQLQQTVNYTSETSEFNCMEIRLIGEVVTLDGPSDTSDASEAQLWNGMLKTSQYLQPSLPNLSTKASLLSFQYALRVVIEMADGVCPNMIEEFPIEIGCPLEPDAPSAPLEENQPSSSTLQAGFGFPPRNAAVGASGMVDLIRRVSLVSLTPSLPDYEAATASAMRRRNSAGNVSIQPPPSYSSLNLDKVSE